MREVPLYCSACERKGNKLQGGLKTFDEKQRPDYGIECRICGPTILYASTVLYVPYSLESGSSLGTTPRSQVFNLRLYLTQSDLQVVLPKSTPTQNRQRIRYISNSEG